jgi:hypothetical protein
MFVTAFFTSAGVPEPGLTPTLRIRDVSTNALVVTDDSMTEVGDGWYKYDFTVYDPDTDYVVRCDGGAGLSGSDRYAFAGTDSESGDLIAKTVQPYILTDATPFKGADIAAIKSDTDQAATMLALIQQVERGSWEVKGVQMFFYEPDNVTPLLTFNLFDDQGNPTGVNIFKRVPV